MKTFKKVLAIVLTGLSFMALTACHDDFDYDYMTPPVTVTPGSNSEAHYGAPSNSSAHYGAASNSQAHYGSSAPVPPVQVSPNNSSGAYYGH